MLCMIRTLQANSTILQNDYNSHIGFHISIILHNSSISTPPFSYIVMTNNCLGGTVVLIRGYLDTYIKSVT